MRTVIGNKIIFDSEVKCSKCGTIGSYDYTSKFLCRDCMPTLPICKPESTPANSLKIGNLTFDQVTRLYFYKGEIF